MLVRVPHLNNISISAAQGLNFLHSGVVPRVIHRDIKDSNILIDINLVAKIADFGLAKHVKLTSDPRITSVSTTIFKGTFGYLDPEYFFTQKLTTKTDVYAFGVVLLVILSGRQAVDLNLVEDQHSLTEWARKCIKDKRLDLIIDPYLAGRISSKSLQQFVKIVQKCLCRQSEQRPTMKEVIAGLQLALKKQATTSGTSSRQPGKISSLTQKVEAKLRTIHKETHPVGDIVRRLLEGKGRMVKLSEEEIKLLCVRAQQIFLSQPNLLEVKAPIKICGDMRGNYENLLSIFEFGGFPPSSAYLFLGDYVDHAAKSLDTICLLLAYKILYPGKVFLLKGKVGFYGKCDSGIFECLPVAALVGGKIFCVHGGLSPELKHMKQIEELPRPTTIPEDGLLRDLLWSTPSSEINGWGMDSGHYSYMFGPDKVAEFLKNNELDLICRSGLVVDGYEFFAERGLVTICAAACRYFSEYPAIQDLFQYAGAILTVDKSMMCSFEILRKIYPEAFYATKFQFRRGPVFNTKTKVGCWNNEDWSSFVGEYY